MEADLLPNPKFGLVPLAIVWFLDRREPESKWLYLIAVLWGALIATGIAAPINSSIIQAVTSFLELHPDVKAILGDNAQMMIAASLAAPIVEEATKGIGVLLLF